MADLVSIRMILTGGAQVRSEAKATAASIAETGKAVEASAAKSATGGKAISKSLSQQASTMRKVGGGMRKYMTYPLLGLAAASVGFAVDFDKAMRNVNSIAGLPEAKFRKLSKSVLDLAGPTNQAPKTLAEGLYDLVSSGFDANESLTILKSSAKAATAGLTTTETATAAVAASLNAYQLPASKARQVSDQLFETVNRGVLRFDQLASTIGDVLPFASQLGVGLDQLGAATSTMTKGGLSSAETMTRIKNVLVTLLKPGKALSETLDAMGTTGEGLVRKKGLQGALEAILDTTDGTKTAVAGLFPNIRAMGGVLSLTGKNAGRAAEDLRAFKDTAGATNKVFKEQEKSFSFKVTQAYHELQVALIELAPALLALTPAVVAVAHGLVTVIDGFTGLPKPVKTFILIMAGVIALAGPVLSLVGAIAALGVSLGTIAIVGAVAAGVIALGVAFLYAYKKIGWFHDAVDAVFGFVKAHWKWLIIPLGPVIAPLLGIYHMVKKIIWGFEKVRDLLGILNSDGGNTYGSSVPGSTPGPAVIGKSPRTEGIPGGGRDDPFRVPGIGAPPRHGVFKPKGRRGALSNGLGWGGERIRPSSRAGAFSGRGGGRTQVTVPLYLGKRQVAEAVAEVNHDDEARL